MDEIAARYGEKLAGLEDDAKDLFQEAEDAKYKLHKFLDRLQNDNTTIPTKEDMNVLEESFAEEYERFEKIFNKIKEKISEATCKAKFTQDLKYSLMKLNDADYEIPKETEENFDFIFTELNITCDPNEDLGFYLERYEENVYVLEAAEEFNSTLRDSILRSRYKIQKMEEFYERFYEVGLDNLEADAEDLLNAYEFAKDMMECIDTEDGDIVEPKVEAVDSSDSSATSSSSSSSLSPPDINESGMKSLCDLVDVIDIFNASIADYNKTAQDSIAVVKENSRQIREFATRRKLEALLKGVDYNRSDIKEELKNKIYKNYKHYIVRVADEFNITLPQVRFQTSEVVKEAPTGSVRPRLSPWDSLF